MGTKWKGKQTSNELPIEGQRTKNENSNHWKKRTNRQPICIRVQRHLAAWPCVDILCPHEQLISQQVANDLTSMCDRHDPILDIPRHSTMTLSRRPPYLLVACLLYLLDSDTMTHWQGIPTSIPWSYCEWPDITISKRTESEPLNWIKSVDNN